MMACVHVCVMECVSELACVRTTCVCNKEVCVPASEGLQVCFEHEQPPLDAGEAGVSVVFQVGRGLQQTLHALPDELLFLLQTCLPSWVGHTHTHTRAHTQAHTPNMSEV